MVILNDKEFYLMNITLDECNENYLNWMNDSEINKYLEYQTRKYSSYS